MCRLACGLLALNMREARNDASFAPHALRKLDFEKDAMLSFLFRRLTDKPASGGALFDALTSEARQKHWYVEGSVPDSLDGRFAVLATLTAIANVRLERDGDEGERLSVALAERFIQVMESEHRELGIGDPALGRTVRKLVAILAKRTGQWRSVSHGEANQVAATRESLYRGAVPAGALEDSAAALERFTKRLDGTALVDLHEGKLG
jgi:cytochrome b pre-mRNA-processing protein 3